MKYLVTLLIIAQCALISYGIYDLSIGKIAIGTFLVLANSIFMAININSLIKRP